jgi:aminoglycoside phosphotransferase (APT) family kinase protein
MLEAHPLWSSLAEHAAPVFSKWLGSGFCALHRELIDSLDRWWSEVEGMPHTLIHNDCNPRNLAFRQPGGSLRLCLYDWELATTGLPQHDLAELLCFVLGPQFHLPDVFGYIERHRRGLERHSGHAIDASVWRQGFRLSLNDLMINRLPAYAMIHRFQKQRFLERVVRTWMALKKWAECV